MTTGDTVLARADGLRWCAGELPLRILNCRRAPLVLFRIEIRDGRNGPVLIEPNPPPRLEGGQRWDYAYRIRQEGEIAIVAFIASNEGGELESIDGGIARVKNPTREAMLRACQTCDGQWGVWGMFSREGCNCRTHDTGKICHDGDACEGLCLFTHFEVVKRSDPLSCNVRGCRADPALGMPVGKCSEFVSLFGCRPIVGRGASRQPPRPLPARAPTLCID